MLPTSGEPAPYALNVVRAEGAWAFDALGKRYLDLQTPHAALNFGHRHPKLVAAAKTQLDRLHRTSYLLPADGMGQLTAALARLCGTEEGHLLTSRYEALQHVGHAVRHAHRRAGANGRAIVVVAPPGEGASHPEWHAEGLGGPLQAVPWGELAPLRAALEAGAAAVLLEPASVRQEVELVAPGYLAGAAAACAAMQVPLVVDESRTGLGRFGPLLASAQDGVQADLLVLGHALGGGIVPLTAVVGRRALLAPVAPHASRSPLAGNALACSIAQASVDLLADGELVRRGQAMGQRLRQGLLAADLPAIAEVRGRGLWLSIRLRDQLGPARPFCEKLLGQGVLTIDATGGVLQVAPPLVIEPREVDWALERMVEALGVPA